LDAKHEAFDAKAAVVVGYARPLDANDAAFDEETTTGQMALLSPTKALDAHAAALLANVVFDVFDDSDDTLTARSRVVLDAYVAALEAYVACVARSALDVDESVEMGS